MSKYVKKPIVIEAFRYCFEEEPEWSLKSAQVNHCQTNNDMWLEIETLEGIMKAMPGDYIIQGIKGEIYPCKADIFKDTYDPVIDSYVAQVGSGFDPLDLDIWNNRGNIVSVPE